MSGTGLLHPCSPEIRRHELQLRDHELALLMGETISRAVYPEEGNMKEHVRKRLVTDETRQRCIAYSQALLGVALARGWDRAEAWKRLNPLALFNLQPAFGMAGWDEERFIAAALQLRDQRLRCVKDPLGRAA